MNLEYLEYLDSSDIIGFIVIIILIFIGIFLPIITILENNLEAEASQEALKVCEDKNFLSFESFSRKFLTKAPIGIKCSNPRFDYSINIRENKK